MGAPGLDFGELLQDQLAHADRWFASDELAFLALTSKVELPIRDRLAYSLYQELPGLLVAREWRRVDLAVLSREGDPAPRMLLEAKALYTFDLVGDDSWVRRFPDKVERDLENLRGMEGLTDATELFGLVLATHPVAPVEIGLKQVAKYSGGIAKALTALGDADSVAQEARRNLESRLGHLGRLHRGRIAAGKAYGVPLDVHYWLVGPIGRVRPPMPPT